MTYRERAELLMAEVRAKLATAADWEAYAARCHPDLRENAIRCADALGAEAGNKLAQVDRINRRFPALR